MRVREREPGRVCANDHHRRHHEPRADYNVVHGHDKTRACPPPKATRTAARRAAAGGRSGQGEAPQSLAPGEVHPAAALRRVPLLCGGGPGPLEPCMSAPAQLYTQSKTEARPITRIRQRLRDARNISASL